MGIVLPDENSLGVEKYKCVDGTDRIQMYMGTYPMTNVPFQFSGGKNRVCFLFVCFNGAETVDFTFG